MVQTAQVMIVHNETELIAAARQGDGAAFAELIRPQYQVAFRVAYGLLHNVDEAEDAVQEAAFKAWRRLGTSRGREPAAVVSSHRRQPMPDREQKQVAVCA